MINHVIKLFIIPFFCFHQSAFFLCSDTLEEEAEPLTFDWLRASIKPIENGFPPGSYTSEKLGFVFVFLVRIRIRYEQTNPVNLNLDPQPYNILAKH